MWICPTCGEPHQDQFVECWKCAGAAMPEHLAENPTLLPANGQPARERRLRPFSYIFARAAVGFLAGAVLGVGIAQRSGISFQAASLVGLTVGMVLGVALGLVVWVFFPYYPGDETDPGAP